MTEIIDKSDTLSGSAQITAEGIKKHFQNIEPYQALIELAWNGYDALANSVKIAIKTNEIDGLETLTVLDDGEGIDTQNISNSFGKFNESEKKHDETKHGSHGKGRLAFHKLCDNASWFTKNNKEQARIDIQSKSIKDYVGVTIEDKDQSPLLKKQKTGTCVELSNFSDNALPDQKSLLKIFSDEFGWFLALNPETNLKINNVSVAVPQHEVHETNFEIDGHKFKAKVIRWISKPNSEKSYNYLITSRCRIIKKELSKFNNKMRFHTSAFVYSDWIDQYDPEALELDPSTEDNQKIYVKIMKAIQDFQRDIYKDYLRAFVDKEIAKYDENGYFPSYSGLDPNFAHWRKENTKTVLREVYIAEPTIFNNLKSKQTKIIIRLLDALLVSNENDALFDVLNSVLDLNDESIKSLADQLTRTTLENIVSTIEALQKREIAVHKLREIIGNRYTEILETPDLQKIIENNTWLFGAQYTTIGAEEDTFTKAARRLREEVKGINDIQEEELFEGVSVDGAQKQVDLFLARKIPTVDSSGKEIYKCVIVEIKRPSISLNKKHLQQLDDYAEIISKDPNFSSDKLRFELILIGRKISKDDMQIRQRLTTLKDRCEYGLVTDDGKMKCYVKDWFTIFDEFSLSNTYLISTLQTKLYELSDIETKDMVKSLQGEAA